MKHGNVIENGKYEIWKDTVQFPRPSTSIETLRTELLTWNAYIFANSEARGAGIRNWGYYPDSPIPEIVVQATKCESSITCYSKFLLACIVWLERDSHVVSFYQPIEQIVMKFDNVEYFINADLWVECKDGEVWMLNLIDTKTEELCRSKPNLLEAIEVFCQSINCTYFPIREEDLKVLPLKGYNNMVDNSGHVEIDAFPREGDWNPIVERFN